MMVRLIDADALVALIQQEPTDGMYTEEIVAVIAEQPTIEAAPVVHGRWEAVHDGWGRCPNCHRMDSIHEKATHCRFCGTKMDGGVSDG